MNSEEREKFNELERRIKELEQKNHLQNPMLRARITAEEMEEKMRNWQLAWKEPK